MHDSVPQARRTLKLAIPQRSISSSRFCSSSSKNAQSHPLNRSRPSLNLSCARPRSCGRTSKALGSAGFVRISDRRPRPPPIPTVEYTGKGAIQLSSYLWLPESAQWRYRCRFRPPKRTGDARAYDDTDQEKSSPARSQHGHSMEDVPMNDLIDDDPYEVSSLYTSLPIAYIRDDCGLWLDEDYHC